MKTSSSDNSITIIGAGFAGLAAGIYARLNGYDTHILEMHDQPGGLCTSWSRKGFTFDGCIHWLVGSSPSSGLHDMWEETGIARNREFIDMEEYMRFEDSSGRTLVLHTDTDRLEKSLLEFSPSDEKPIRDFIRGIRMCVPFDMPSKHDSLIKRLRRVMNIAIIFIYHGRKMKEWMNITCNSFSERFKDPLLREAFREMWVPEFSMLFVLFTFAYLHKKNAGYPIGGSMPMSQALENRYKELGGKISYNSRISRIITENDTATGVQLEDGTEIRSGRVISAADGYATLFNMLEGRYVNDKIREQYEKWPVFPGLIFVSLGVKRTFPELPMTVSGFTFRLREPVEIGDKMREKLSVHIYNHDKTMAPDGSTAITLMLETDYGYWKNLSSDRAVYLKKKEQVSQTIIALLDQRFPGISAQVEVIDVATPLTFERYTGNWKGSFEGWLITPSNAGVLMHPMSQSLPGLKNFYMCGQWVEPGGGLPTSIMSGRRLIKKLCGEDHRKFRSS